MSASQNRSSSSRGSLSVGLHHHRARHRERDRRGVEPVVDEALRDVDLVEAVAPQRPQIQDQLVRDPPVVPGVQHVVVRGEARLDVVGAEYRGRGGPPHAVRPEHPDVAVRDEENAGASPRRRRDRGNRPFAADRRQRMPGQIRREMLRAGDRPHAGSSAAMGNRERLVQVDMADVGADRGGAGHPDLGVQVRPVHVHLAAGVVDDLADLPDGVLEDPVRGRVGDHQAAQGVAVRRRLGAQVVEVDVAAVVAGHHHDPHPRHGRGGGVRAVGGRRNQDHVAAAAPMVAMPGANDHEPREHSPCAPELGCSDTAGSPVMAASAASSSLKTVR